MGNVKFLLDFSKTHAWVAPRPSPSMKDAELLAWRRWMKSWAVLMVMSIPWGCFPSIMTSTGGGTLSGIFLKFEIQSMQVAATQSVTPMQTISEVCRCRQKWEIKFPRFPRYPPFVVIISRWFFTLYILLQPPGFFKYELSLIIRSV